jgi:Kdo2-lipid IVA lauroyltransferase/acyltransferase
MPGAPCPMYRPLDNPVLEKIVARNRRRLFGELVPHDNIRALVRLLRQGEVVWYAPDQNYRRRQSAMVPFFGIAAPTNTGTARLAMLTGAPVLPFFVQRLPGAKGYRLHLWPALEDFPSDDPVADSARINRIFEQQIERCPEQYFWVHQRFKKRPAGYPDLYADIK